MVDRRRAGRYRFRAPVPANVSFVQDAILESFDGARAHLVTSQAATPGDELVVLFRAPGSAPLKCVMRVCSSTPCTGESGGYRLDLSLIGAPDAPDLAILAYL